MIDAHHHVWRLADRGQPWIDPVTMAAIHRDFDLTDLAGPARAAGVVSTVVVQTVADPGETPELLALAGSGDVVAAFEQLTADLSATERAAVRGGTARRWYGLLPT